MQIKVLDKTDKVARFVVIDNNGNESRPQDIVLESLFSRAKNIGQPLEIAIAQEIGVDLTDMPVVDETEPEARSGVSVADLRNMFSVVGHAHPHDHPHDHDSQYAPRAHDHQSAVELAKRIDKHSEELTLLGTTDETIKHDLKFHAHDTPEHAHPAFQGQLDALRDELKSLRSAIAEVQPHAHTGIATSADLVNTSRQLNESIAKLNMAISEVERKIPVLPEMPDLDEAKVEAIVHRILGSKSTKAQFVEISSQEVNGRKRYTVEEV